MLNLNDFTYDVPLKFQFYKNLRNFGHFSVSCTHDKPFTFKILSNYSHTFKKKKRSNERNCRHLKQI